MDRKTPAGYLQPPRTMSLQWVRQRNDDTAPFLQLWIMHDILHQVLTFLLVMFCGSIFSDKKWSPAFSLMSLVSPPCSSKDPFSHLRRSQIELRADATPGVVVGAGKDPQLMLYTGAITGHRITDPAPVPDPQLNAPHSKLRYQMSTLRAGDCCSDMQWKRQQQICK
jgi:hypothetical protein